MKLQVVLPAFGLCLIVGAGPGLAANPVEGLGDTPTRPGLERQDTGMSDPTVNPGQAAETRSVHGVVLRLQDGGYVIQDAKGHEVNLLVDGETTGNKDLNPGDYVKAKLTRQGRAISIIKETEKDRAREKIGR
ncbi:MAG: hypothetical protein NVS1B6_10690 [Steroidobacteraceae bacterium]